MPKKVNKAAQSLGRLAWKATFKKHGNKAFSKGGKKGGAALLEKYGPDYFKAMRQKSIEKRAGLKSKKKL